MGSHYIPVGKLKIDKAILDIACPTVGYYDPNLPLPYIPPGGNPATDPPSEDDVIVLICSNQYDGAINYRVTTSSGQYRTDIYDLGNTLIDTVLTDSESTIFYAFNSATGTTGTDGNKYYRVVITPVTGGAGIRIFTVRALTNYAAYSWPIIEAHIKSPGLTDLASAFLNQKALKIVKFYTDVNNLVSIQQVVNGCINLNKFDMSVSANSLNSIASAFLNTPKLEEVKLPLALPALLTAGTAFHSSGIKANPLPSTLPEVTNMSLVFFNCKNLKGTITFTNMPKVTTFVNGVSSSAISKVVITGDFNDLSIDSLAQNCELLTEVILNGTWNNAINMYRFIKGSLSVKRIECNVTLTGTNPTLWDPTDFETDFILTDLLMPVFNGTGNITVRQMFHSLTSFICPTLKPTLFNLFAGSSRSAKIESVDIDWASNVSDITLRYGNLPTAEINRIFTLIPTVTANTIDVRNNPGYATCDKTIATAKGWTVS